MTTTWTKIGRKHVAQYRGWSIGRITEKMCKTNEPFLDVSMHGQVKDFLILQHAKRWIVERTFAWLKRYRRHSKDYERNPESSVAMIYIAMTKNMLIMLDNNALRI